MRFYFLFIILTSLYGKNVHALTVTCTGGSTMQSVTLPVQSCSVTTSGEGDPSGFTKLATWKYFRLSSVAQCNINGNLVMQTVVYISPYDHRQPFYHSGQWIFPTSVNGVGISFKAGLTSPQTQVGTTNNAAIIHFGGIANHYSWTSLAVEITLWKTPVTSGENEIPADGALHLSGQSYLR